MSCYSTAFHRIKMQQEWPCLYFIINLEGRGWGSVHDIRKSSPSSRFGIAQSVGYGLDDRGSIPGGGWKFFSSTPCPDRL